MKTKKEILEKGIEVVKPSILGIYFLTSKSEILYVGSSRNVHNRIRTHYGKKEIRFTKFLIIPYTDEAQMKVDEKEYIKTFTPKFNIKDNPIAKKEELRALEILKKKPCKGVYNWGYGQLNRQDIEKVFKQNSITPKVQCISNVPSKTQLTLIF